MKHTSEYQALLDSGLFREYEKERSRQWRLGHNFEGVASTPFLSQESLDEKVEKIKDSLEIDDGHSLYALCLCDRLHNIKVKRASRLKKWVFYCIKDGNGQFLTLTFRDEVLQNTSPDTRRQYVRRFLQKHCSDYVANIDFGANNGREHYHAIVKDFDESEWKFGFKKYKKIAFNAEGKSLRDFYDEYGHLAQDDVNRLSKYLAKLTNHALKTLGTGKRFIYSR